MSNYKKEAWKKSTRYVPETCPEVDRALGDIEKATSAADSIIKKQTEALREALVEQIQEVMSLEEKISDLEREIEELKGELERLK